MRLNEIYERHKHSDIRFFAVYIREAHPDDGWRVPENLEQNIHFDEPRTDAERTEVAAVCRTAMDIRMPLLIDRIGNDVEEKYIATPIRLFVVDRAGRVAYTGEPGPFGFDPDSWEAAIEDQIAGGSVDRASGLPVAGGTAIADRLRGPQITSEPVA